MNRDFLYDRWRVVGAFLIGFTIPISISYSEIITGLAFLSLLLDRRTRENWPRLRANPVVWASLGLFALLGLAMLYSVAPVPEAARFWIRYRELLYLPLFLLLCRDDRAARAGLFGFLATMILMMVSTFIEWLVAHKGGQPIQGRIFPGPNYITGGVMMSLAAFYFAVEAIRSSSRRIPAAIAAALAVSFVLFLSPGRTGYFVLIALAVLLLFQAAPRRFWLAGAMLVGLGAASVFLLSSELGNRLADIGTSLSGEANDSGSMSALIRLQFYRGSLLAIARHPVFGTGTGSFARVYKEIAQANNLFASTNPHNEYLLMGVQVGIVGIAAFLALLGTLWLHAARLPEADAWRGRALAVALAVGCLFNSLLLNHIDGQSFAFQAGLFFFGAREREDQNRHRGT